MFWIPILISILTLVISIIINACLVAFLLGKLSANQEAIRLLLETQKEHTTEHFNRLEQKQDKHNNLIERMAIVEQASKSAHEREDDIVKRLEKLEVYKR